MNYHGFVPTISLGLVLGKFVIFETTFGKNHWYSRIIIKFLILVLDQKNC